MAPEREPAGASRSRDRRRPGRARLPAPGAGSGIRGAAGVHALLPVKDLEEAKQRLSPVLDARERRDFFAAMLEDVLEALAAATALAGVLVLTRHPGARALAERHGASLLGEARNLGQSGAVSFGARTLGARGAAGIIAVPADVPLLRPEDLDTVLAAHRAAPSVTVVPARDGLGTNAVACSPPEVLPFRFGGASFRLHLARARALGLAPRVLRRPRLALDVDTPADLRAFSRRASDTRAYRYLRDSGILARLHPPEPGDP